MKESPREESPSVSLSSMGLRVPMNRKCLNCITDSQSRWPTKNRDSKHSRKVFSERNKHSINLEKMDQEPKQRKTDYKPCLRGMFFVNGVSSAPVSAQSFAVTSLLSVSNGPQETLQID